jgi:hypothetical protein
VATGGSVGTGVEDDFMDPILDNLNKEIAELRERRITHNLNKQRFLEDDEDLDDDFEAAFFTETILGELGSSSSSHKNRP